MFEYAAFNPFNASPEALAAELTRKSAEGWELVSIHTAADGRLCAFLRRPVNSTVSTTPIGAAGVASAAAVGASGAASTASGSTTDVGYGAARISVTANPSIPAAWYNDPSGRYELRYWNGTAWTEHVARGGQQFTDPPVA